MLVRKEVNGIRFILENFDIKYVIFKILESYVILFFDNFLMIVLVVYIFYLNGDFIFLMSIFG